MLIISINGKIQLPYQDLFPMQFVRLFQMNSRQISDCNCASSLRRKKWAASDVVGEVSQTETAQRLSRFGIASYLHAWNKVLITKKYKGLLSNMSQCKFCKTSKVAYIWQNKVVNFYLKKLKHSNLQFKISYKPSTPIKRHQSGPCKTIWCLTICFCSHRKPMFLYHQTRCL